MPIINLSVSGQVIRYDYDTSIVAGEVGVHYVQTTYDDEWNVASSRVLCFTGSGKSVAVLDDGGSITIPWETVEKPGMLHIGVIGYDDAGSIVITTRMQSPHNSGIRVYPNTTCSGDASPPAEFTPSIWAQAISSIGQLPKLKTENKNNLVDAINEVFDRTGNKVPDVVLYTPQELTEEQQTQARENIGAAETGDYLEGGDVFGWAQKNQFDRGNFTGGTVVTVDGVEYYRYKDNGTNFIYTMPHPQPGSVTINWKYTRLSETVTAATGFYLRYSDGSNEHIKVAETAVDTLITFTTPEDKTLVYWSGDWNMEQYVYLPLDEISITADYVAPEQAEVMSGATADAAGSAGLAPAPAAGDQDKVLYGDGTWKTPDVPDEQIADAVEDYLAANPPEVVLDGYIPNPTTAAVGQTIRVSAVDDSGKPTAWEAVDMAENTINIEWNLLADISLAEDTAGVVVSTDINGEPFSCSEISISAQPISDGTNRGLSFFNSSDQTPTSRVFEDAGNILASSTTNPSRFVLYGKKLVDQAMFQLAYNAGAGDANIYGTGKMYGAHYERFRGEYFEIVSFCAGKPGAGGVFKAGSKFKIYGR